MFKGFRRKYLIRKQHMTHSSAGIITSTRQSQRDKHTTSRIFRSLAHQRQKLIKPREMLTSRKEGGTVASVSLQWRAMGIWLVLEYDDFMIWFAAITKHGKSAQHIHIHQIELLKVTKDWTKHWFVQASYLKASWNKTWKPAGTETNIAAELRIKTQRYHQTAEILNKNCSQGATEMQGSRLRYKIRGCFKQPRQQHMFKYLKKANQSAQVNQ